jgi:hypothetical protein
MPWISLLATPPNLAIFAQVGALRQLEFLTGGLGLIYFAFMCWMLVHCVRTEPDRQFWMWLIIVVWGVGPAVYFVVRYLPSVDYRGPEFLLRWTRGRELERLETAAIQIGNPHQFTRWGDALREVGKLDEAARAYQKALEKDPKDLPALWGAARVAALQQRFADVRDITRKILDKDPQYKFGDVSLELGKSLMELGERAAAVDHFDSHVRRWRHPEALYALARLRVEEGDVGAARDHLQSMLHDINGSPAAIARKHGRWKSRARQLLRKLPANA